MQQCLKIIFLLSFRRSHRQTCDEIQWFFTISRFPERERAAHGFSTFWNSQIRQCSESTNFFKHFEIPKCERAVEVNVSRFPNAKMRKNQSVFQNFDVNRCSSAMEINVFWHFEGPKCENTLKSFYFLTFVAAMCVLGCRKRLPELFLKMANFIRPMWPCHPTGKVRWFWSRYALASDQQLPSN